MCLRLNAVNGLIFMREFNVYAVIIRMKFHKLSMKWDFSLKKYLFKMLQIVGT